MKMSFLFLPLLCLSAFADEKPARAEQGPKRLEGPGDPQDKLPDRAKFNLHFDLLIIALPPEDAPLVDQMQNPASLDPAFAELLRKVSEAKARIVGIASLITKSGERAVAENIDEVRYPIEFEPPSLNESGKAFAEDPKGEPSPDTPPSVAAVKDPAPIEMLAAIPTGFETRNAGVSLELEPTLDPATMQIHLQLATQRVVFKGMEKHSITIGNTTSIVEQPRFATNKVQTVLTIKSGGRVLLGTFKSPDLEGWTEMHILRATAQLLK